MPAATSSTVYTTTPIAGVDVGAKGSTMPGGLKVLTAVLASDGHEYIVVQAAEALGSIETVKVSAAGIASSDAGSVGFTMNAPGGLVTGQKGWAKKTAL